jgi:hypothetical protein
MLPSFKHPLMEHLGGATSDHLWRAIRVSKLGMKKPITVGTWNMLMKCASQKVSGSYANNPLNLEETGDQYEARFGEQVREILEKLDVDDIDVLFLQEVNEILSPTEENADKIGENYLNYFQQVLCDKGYDIIASPYERRVANKEGFTLASSNQKPKALITIFRRKRLQLKRNPICAVQEAGRSKRNTVMISAFEDVEMEGDNKEVVCANLHLDWPKSTAQCEADIEALKAQNLSALFIAGGDANHNRIKGMTGDLEIPTTVAASESEKKAWTRKTTLFRSFTTTRVTGLDFGGGEPERIDGFFINAPEAEKVGVEITELPSQTFEVKDDGKEIFLKSVLGRGPYTLEDLCFDAGERD